MRRQRLEVVRSPAQAEVEVRCLADYDTALGLDESSAGGSA
jgi:mevalonate pyrophosphate decarboxylase